MNELTDDEHEQEQEASVISPGLNIYHGIAYQSSPIKLYDDSNSSVKVSPNFNFLHCIYLHKQNSNNNKTQHFHLHLNQIAKIKRDCHYHTIETKQTGEVENEGIDFVLSPFKLTPSQPSYPNDDLSVFPETNNGKTSVIKRYSATKPTHSRYNSHDLVPIKVEFEKLESGVRSTSVPEKSLKELLTCETIDENTGHFESIRMSKHRMVHYLP